MLKLATRCKIELCNEKETSIDLVIVVCGFFTKYLFKGDKRLCVFYNTERLRKRVRYNLSKKLFSADLVPGTSCKSIVKQIHTRTTP